MFGTRKWQNIRLKMSQNLKMITCGYFIFSHFSNGNDFFSIGCTTHQYRKCLKIILSTIGHCHEQLLSVRSIGIGQQLTTSFANTFHLSFFNYNHFISDQCGVMYGMRCRSQNRSLFEFHHVYMQKLEIIFILQSINWTNKQYDNRKKLNEMR